MRWDGTAAGSFIGRVKGVPTGALPDPDRPTTAWFGSHPGELPTVQDLQQAIGDYAVLRSDLRATLEVDRTGPADQPPSPAPLGPLQLVASNRSRPTEEESPDPSTGRALPELALMTGLLAVVLVLMLIAVLGGAANL